MSHMLPSFWKKSKLTSPVRDRAPANVKFGEDEQGYQAQTHVRIDGPTSGGLEPDEITDDLAHEVKTDRHLIEPNPLTFSNPSPVFSDACETVHEQSEDTNSDPMLQNHEDSHFVEHTEPDPRAFYNMQHGQQANMEDSWSDQNPSSPLQHLTNVAAPSVDPKDPTERKDDTAVTHPESSQPGRTNRVQTTSCDVSHSLINPATPDRETTDVPPTDEVSDAASQTLTKAESSSAHNANANGIGVPKCQKLSRGSSAPPEVCNDTQHKASTAQLGNRKSFVATTTITANMPAHIQMLNQLQSWTLHLGDIKDAELRQQLINAISCKMEKAWIDAMRMGLIPVHWQDDEETQADLERIPTVMSALRFIEPGITDHDIVQDDLYPRGRRTDKDQTRKKRFVSPAREVVIDTGVHRGSKAYGITAGELYECGVSIHTIQTRVQARSLDDKDELLTDTLEDLDQTEMYVSNWLRVVPSTACNTLGRDLKLYCLWEMQKSRSELELLQSLLGTFRHTNQIRNTERRIKVEQELHDQLLALALELEAKENGGIDPRECSSGVPFDVAPVAGQNLVSDLDGDEIEEHAQQTIRQDAQACHNLTAIDQASLHSTGMKLPIQSQENHAQIEQRAVTSIVSAQGIDHRNKGEIRSELIVKVEPDLKRAAEDAQPISEPPAKKQRREIEDDNVDLPDTRVQSTSPSSLSSSLPPETALKQRAYVRFILRPKANQYLQRADRPLIRENASWPEIRDALKAAGIHAGIRNVLIKDYKECVDNWDIPVTEEDGELEINDIVGYPTRKEIFNSLKPEGVTGNDLKEIFAGRVNFMDTKWQTLVQSVACYDRAAGRWYRKDELAEKLRHRMVVSLRVPGLKSFKPEDYSSRTVNNTHGFHWRYLPTSTVAQRHSMDEFIDRYVKHTKEGEKAVKTTGAKGQSKYEYHGRYEVLINPIDYNRSIDPRDRDPELEPPPAIVHGVWDFRGRKNEDNKVHGLEWFYEGKDGEVVDRWVVRRTKQEDGTVTRIVEKEVEDMSTEDQVSGRGREVPAKSAKIKLNVNSMVAGTGLDGAVGPSLATGNHRSVAVPTAKWTDAGNDKKVKALSAPQPIAMTRQRRSKTKVVRYADDGDDDSDGEYHP